MSIVGAPLQAVTEALGEALTEAQVAAAILRTGLQPFGADAGVVTRLSADGSELEILGSVGYTDETAQAWPLIPVQAPLPISESVRKREPLFLSGIELRRFGPVPGLTAQAVVCIPLFARGRMLGALAATFGAEREFPADERQLLVTLGRLCSQALDRARAFERERQSRE
ncbi:MAG: GAF domain-containing protein, partial [Deltaproteobacteria bacterium]|nr:GAF domain-containing protein [Deltaproteobacteria bacterium]